jgi:hypothetical protein
MPERLCLLMDRAYQGDETRQLVLDLGMVPVVPPRSNRIERPRPLQETQRDRAGSSAD